MQAAHADNVWPTRWDVGSGWLCHGLLIPTTDTPHWAWQAFDSPLSMPLSISFAAHAAFSTTFHLHYLEKVRLELSQKLRCVFISKIGLDGFGQRFG